MDVYVDSSPPALPIPLHKQKCPVFILEAKPPEAP